MNNLKQRLQQAWSHVFPTPRQKVTWKDAIPFVLFLLAFGGLCLWLEFTDRLMFVRPWAFLLLLVTPWVWWMAVAGYAGLSKARTIVSLLVRLSLVGLFVILIAEPRAVRTRDVLSVVYVVDISDSVDQSTDRALEFVAKTVNEKPEEDEAGLIVFGRDAAVELPPRISFPFENVVNSRIQRDATNLEQALALAAAMLPEENRGRIVLVSDGTETAGNLRDIVDDLKSRGIGVDVLPIGYEYEKEVYLERLDLPSFVKTGENYQASIVLSSLTDGEGRLVVKENNQTEPIFDEVVQYKKGKNRFELPIQLREPGYYEYKATIQPPEGEDNLDTNNEVVNFLFIEGEGKVLLVTDPEAVDDSDYALLKKTIEATDRTVEVRSAYNFPRDSLSLMPYDAVMFVNVAKDSFDSVQLNSLRDSVFNLGIGFGMVGGKNSFGPGGYHRSVVEEILPVTMDISKKKVLPKGALVVILHTCEFPEGNTWAKRISKEAIKVLGGQDEAGLIAYEYQDGEKWIFELTPASEYDSLVPKINAAEIGDMPSFTDTMELGLEGLKKSDAASRHMIIISDGDPPIPPRQLLNDFKVEEITVSTVAIYPHSDRDIQSLRAIANVTGGRFYFPDDPAKLPSIFIKEAKTLKRNMIQNRTVMPQLEFPDPVVDGLAVNVPVHGFVLTTPKESQRAKTVLKLPGKDGETEDIDPLLVVGRYGLGATAAFTSDLSPNWGRDWLAWDGFQPFIKQFMTRISRVRKQGHLRMWTYTNGNEGVVILEDFHPDDAFLDVKARIAGPRDKVETISVKQIGPRRYQATVPLWGRGRYQVMVSASAGERKESAQGGFIVPYSPEYLRFRADTIVLNEIADATGGESLLEENLDAASDEPPADAEPGETSETDNTPDTGLLASYEEKAAKTIYGRRSPKRSSWPIFDWFLIALACLIPLDVGLRRVQLDWYAVKSLLGLERKTESTRTMGQLLKRKQSVDSTLDKKKKEAPLPASLTRPKTGTVSSTPAGKQSAAMSSGAQKATQPKPKDDPTPTEDPNSTTSRLLAMKRKRDDN